MTSAPILLAATCGAAQSVHDSKLPPETAVLRSSTLPGYAIALQKCGNCHSADYINQQPPHMSLTQWTGEMTKMQHSYGAPIDESEIKLLGIYLAATYGDATTVSSADMTPAVASQSDGPGGDVHSVLDRNACLSCHATQQKVVGPSYHDVAARYQGDPQARSKVEANIRAGGSGKWGPVPMPPFPNLSPGDLQALADFVLRQ